MTQVDVDVGSSTTASSVVGLVAGAVKSLVIDMAIVLQARSVRARKFCFTAYAEGKALSGGE